MKTPAFRASVPAKIASWLIVLAAVIGFLILVAGWMIGKYNTLVELDGTVINEWAQVETQYQRRADLIPNIVATVEGAADFEKSTLTEVTEARTNWMNTSADASATIEEQMESASAFDSALSRLLVTVESYPTLTATESFNTLIVELEGTENRISVARQDYNDVATNYNITIKKIPMNLFAALFGFDQHSLFESDEGSEEAPEIDFEF
jgi:LemA protein